MSDTSLLCKLPVLGRSAVETRKVLDVLGDGLALPIHMGFLGQEQLSTQKHAVFMNLLWPGSYPKDGDVLYEDTILRPGTYKLPNGISFGADDVTLDLNGATLVRRHNAPHGRALATVSARP